MSWFGISGGLPHVAVKMIYHLPAFAAGVTMLLFVAEEDRWVFGVEGSQLDVLALLCQLTGVCVKTKSKYGPGHLITYSLFGRLYVRGWSFWIWPLSA